jgi:uncharacterized protein
MFGFSITKLIFTVVIIAAVWYGFKWLDRLGKERRGELDASRRSGGGGGEGAPPAESAQEMVKCRVCGIFVAASGTGDCGRGDCPYRG